MWLVLRPVKRELWAAWAMPAASSWGQKSSVCCCLRNTDNPWKAGRSPFSSLSIFQGPFSDSRSQKLEGSQLAREVDFKRWDHEIDLVTPLTLNSVLSTLPM